MNMLVNNESYKAKWLYSMLHYKNDNLKVFE